MFVKQRKSYLRKKYTNNYQIIINTKDMPLELKEALHCN